MKNLLILLAIPLFFISCVRDNDGSEENNLVSFDISMSIPSFGVYGTDKSTNSQAAKSSSFEHIFKDEIDVVFTSTTSDFTATLTITPNDLSNTPSIELPYGTYSWTITNDLIRTDGVDYYFPEYLPVYGSGSVEVYSSNVSLNLLVDTNYGLVTVQKENVDSAKIILDPPLEKSLVLSGNSYYTYVAQRDGGYTLEINENKYDTTITADVGEYSSVFPKTHYNYILAFSDVDVNSITLKTAAFEQIDYYLQPTGTASSTCSLTLTPLQSQHLLLQTVAASSTISRVSFIISTTCSETINYTASGLPTGISMEILEANTIPSITGTVSSSVSSGTYNYTITAFNSDNLNTATVSGTVTGTIIVINASNRPDEVAAACENRTFVPDDNFEAELILRGYDDVMDNYVCTENIIGIKRARPNGVDWEINIDNVTDPTGIEDFIGLETLRIYNSDISSIDISNLVNLKELALQQNNLQTLDVSNNTKLTYLRLSDNPLISIDVANLVALKELHLVRTNIETINIINNTELEYLNFQQSNSLTQIDVSKNTKLKNLYLGSNLLTEIDLASNKLLENLRLDDNQLSSLDISSLNCSLLKNLNVANNPSLNCIKIPNTCSVPLAGWTRSSNQSFSTNCN